MPKKRKTKPEAVAKRRRKRRTTITKITKETRETRQNPAANPPISDDLTSVILPGFGAFAATKVLQRLVYQVVQKRFPKLGRHAHALAGALAFGGVWLFAHKIRALAKYHDGIVVGSGIAAAHGIAQCYLPKKYSWLLADCRPEDVRPLPSAKNGAPPPISKIAAPEDDEFSYLEAQIDELDGGRPAPAPPRSNTDVSQVLEPDEELDDLYTGAFATN